MRSPLTVKFILLSFLSILLASCGGGGGGSDSNSSSNVDKKSPGILFSQPADGAPVYGKQQDIRITFDEAIEMTSQTPISVTTLGGEPVTGTAKIEDGQTLVFSPSSPLADSTTYSIRITGIKDLSGNLFDSNDFTIYFRASNQQDSAIPYVINTYPSNGNIADVATTIRLEFNEKVQIGLSTVTVKNLANNQTVGILKRELSRDGRFMEIYLSETLTYARNYSVEVANVYDLSGLRAQNVNFRFSTPGSTDSTPPAVLSTSAQPEYISVKFDKPVKLKPILTRQPVRSVAVRALSTDVSLVDYPSSVVGDGRELLIFPRDGTQFPAGAYALNLGGGLAGMSDQAITLTNTVVVPSPAFNGLTVQYLNKNLNSVGSNESILLKFSSPVLKGLLSGSAENPAYVRLTKGSKGTDINLRTPVDINLTLSANGEVLTIEPIGGLVAGQTYTLSLGAIKNTNGELLNPTETQIVVASSDLTPPTVKSTSPQNKATISQGTIINVVFDEPVKRGNSLIGSAENKANVKLALSTLGYEIATRLTLSADGTVLRVEPLGLLADQSYTLTIDGVYDVSGNRQSVSKQIQLSTVSTSDTSIPSYLGANIASNGEIQPYQPIELYFNETILPYNLGISVVNTSNSSSADISWVQTNNGQTIKIMPPANGYTLGANYQVNVSGIQDLSGNSAPPVSLNFTISATADTQAPKIVSQYPFDQNSTAVNTKEDYVIWFDESIKLAANATASLMMMGNGTEQSLALELASDRALRIKSPTGGLQVSASYALIINGITDNANNLAGNIAITFTAAPTTVSTTVRSDMLLQDPKLTLATNEPIEILFKEPIDESSITVAVSNIATNKAIPSSYDINELKNQLLIKTNGDWPTGASLRLEINGVKSRLSGLSMNGTYVKTSSTTVKPAGMLVVDVTTTLPADPTWQIASSLTANSVNSLQAVFNTPVVAPMMGTSHMAGNTSGTITVQAFLRADKKTVDIILPNPTVSRQTYTLSNWNVTKLDGTTAALPTLTFRVIDAISTLNLFYHKGPQGRTPSNFRFSLDLDEFSRVNGSELLTLKGGCTGTNESASSCAALPSDLNSYAYSWSKLAKISSSAWASTYDQDKSFNSITNANGIVISTNTSNQYSMSLSNTDVLLNSGNKSLKTAYLTEELPDTTPFGRLYRPYLATLPTNYGIDQIVMIGGSSYAQITVGSNVITTDTASSSAIYSTLDGGATWKKIGELPSGATFKGGVAGIKVGVQNYITAVVEASAVSTVVYAPISSSAVGSWLTATTIPTPNNARYRAVVLPDDWSEPHVGKIVMVASSATGIQYVRMSASSSISTGWTVGNSTLIGGPTNQNGFNINIMLSVGRTSGLSQQPETALYMMGDDEYLWLSNDAGATWRGRSGLLTIPKIEIPYFCSTDKGAIRGGPSPQERASCAARPIQPGSDATALVNFNAMGDLIADSKGNLIVSGIATEDVRDLFYQFMLKNDETTWSVQKFRDNSNESASVGCFSFPSLYREGGTSIRFRMGNENAILIVGGRPSNETYGENSVEDLSRYVLRAFERDNYCKLGVPAVRKLNLKNF